MKIDILSQWLSLAANLGVLVGIIFLVIEIDQNTTMMESQVALSRADTAMNQSAVFHESEYIPRIIVAIEQGQQLDEEDRQRYIAYIRGFNRNQDYIHTQYENGLLGEEIVPSMRLAVQTEIAGRSPAREIWANTKQSYSAGYQAFVDGIIREGQQ